MTQPTTLHMISDSGETKTFQTQEPQECITTASATFCKDMQSSTIGPTTSTFVDKLGDKPKCILTENTLYCSRNTNFVIITNEQVGLLAVCLIVIVGLILFKYFK